MSKKEKEVEPDENLDYDFENDEFNFDDFDPDSREPSSGVIKGSLKDFKNALVKPESITKVLDTALPEEFGEVKEKTGDVIDELGKSYTAAVDEVKPGINELARAVDKIVPNNIPFIKNKLKAVIDSTAAEVDDGRVSAAKIREDSIQSELSQIFTAPVSGLGSKDTKEILREGAKERSEEQIKEQVRLTQAATGNNSLSKIENILGNTLSFSQHINATYHRKSLELQFRSYYVLADLLESSKVFHEATKVQNENIIKNTGLPEFVKLNESERFNELARNKLFSTFQESLFGNGDYIRNVGEKLKDKVLEKASGFRTALEQGTQMVEGVGQLKDIAEATGEKFTLGKVLKDYGIGETIGWGLTKAGKKLGAHLEENHPGVGDAVKKVKNIFDSAEVEGNALAKMDFATMAIEEANPVKRMFFTFMDDFKEIFKSDKKSSIYSLENANTESNNPAIFDDLVKRSIVEIIPKYLSGIQNELANIYGSNSNYYNYAGMHMPLTFREKNTKKLDVFKPYTRNNEQLFYDPETGELSTIKIISRNLESKLSSIHTGENVVKYSNEATAILLSDSVIDKKKLKEVSDASAEDILRLEELQLAHRTGNSTVKKELEPKIKEAKKKVAKSRKEIKKITDNKLIDLSDELNTKLNKYIIDTARTFGDSKKLYESSNLRNAGFTDEERALLAPHLRGFKDDDVKRKQLNELFANIRSETRDSTALLGTYGSLGVLRDINNTNDFLITNEDQNNFIVNENRLTEAGNNRYGNTAEETIASAVNTSIRNTEKTYKNRNEEDEETFEAKIDRINKQLDKKKELRQKTLDPKTRYELTNEIKTLGDQLYRLKDSGSNTNNVYFRKSTFNKQTEDVVKANNEIAGTTIFKPIPSNEMDLEIQIADYKKELKTLQSIIKKLAARKNTRYGNERHKEALSYEKDLTDHITTLEDKLEEVKKGNHSDKNLKTDIKPSNTTSLSDERVIKPDAKEGILDKFKKLPVFSWKYTSKNIEKRNTDLGVEDEGDSNVDIKTDINAPKKEPLLKRLIGKFKTSSNNKDKETFIGPMAQDTNAVFGESAAPKGKRINLVTMNGLLTEGLREVSKEVDTVKEKLKDSRPVNAIKELGSKIVKSNTAGKIRDEVSKNSPNKPTNSKAVIDISTKIMSSISNYYHSEGRDNTAESLTKALAVKVKVHFLKKEMTIGNLYNLLEQIVKNKVIVNESDLFVTKATEFLNQFNTDMSVSPIDYNTNESIETPTTEVPTPQTQEEPIGRIARAKNAVSSIFNKGKTKIAESETGIKIKNKAEELYNSQTANSIRETETYKDLSNTANKAAETVKSKVKVAKETVNSYAEEYLVQDVFLNGRIVISKSEFENGKYVTRDDKPVNSILDLVGDIFDRSGNLVVDSEEIKKLEFSNGVKVGDSKLLQRGKKKLTETKKAITERVGKINTEFKEFKNIHKDIYVKDETTPRMLNYLMEKGDYYLNDDNTFITSGLDIKGQVFDTIGNIILTFEDISKGLYYGKGDKAVKVKYSNFLNSAIKNYEEKKTTLEGKLSVLSNKAGIAVDSASNGAISKIVGIYNKVTGFTREISEVYDLYVRNDEGYKLVIEARKIRESKYVTLDGKTIKKVPDIDNEVYELSGEGTEQSYEIVLSSADIVHGVYKFIGGEYIQVDNIGTKKDGKHQYFIKSLTDKVPNNIKQTGMFKSYLDYQLNDKESTYSKLTDILAGAGTTSEKSRAIERLILSKTLFKGPALAGKAAVLAVKATMKLAGVALSPITSPVTGKIAEMKGSIRTGISLHTARKMDTEKLREFIADIAKKTAEGEIVLPERYIKDLNKILELKVNSERGTGNNFASKALIKIGDFVRDKTFASKKDEVVYSKDENINKRLKEIIKETQRKTAAEVEELKKNSLKEVEADPNLGVDKTFFDKLDEIIKTKRERSKPKSLIKGAIGVGKGLLKGIGYGLMLPVAGAIGVLGGVANIGKDFKDGYTTGVPMKDLKDLNQNQLIKIYKEHKDNVSKEYLEKLTKAIIDKEKESKGFISATKSFFTGAGKETDKPTDDIATTIVEKLKAGENKEFYGADELNHANAKKEVRGVDKAEDKPVKEGESWLSKIFGLISGKVVALLGGMVAGIKMIGSLFKSKSAIETAADIAGDLTDGKKSPNGKKPGGIGKKLLGAASTVGRGVGYLARGVTLFNPATLAVTAIAVGGYMTYKYFTSINKKAITKYRMAQYGLTEANADKYDAVLGLEEHLFDKIKMTPKGFKIDVAAMDQEKIAELFGITYESWFNDNDDEHIKNFETWFKERFTPVFLVHMGAIKSLNVKQKTGLIPSFKDFNTHTVHDLDDYEKSRYLELTLFKGGPYSSVTSPFKDLPSLPAGLVDVVNLHEKAKAEIKDLKVRKSKLDIANPNSDTKTMAEYAHENDKEVKKQLEENNSKNDIKSVTDEKVEKPKTTLELEPEPVKALENMDVSKNAAKEVPVLNSPLVEPDPNAVKAVGDADVENLNPAFRDKIYSMGAEYQQLTGEVLPVSSGYRSFKKQEALHKADPTKAAKPGKSLHEYGLAVDIKGETFNKLEELGLTRKYGVTRPVGGEDWHGEPAGIQLNLNDAKKDSNFASTRVEAGIMKGGGGLGSIVGSPLGKRDPFLAASLLGDSVSKALDKKVEESDRNKQLKANLAVTEKGVPLESNKPVYETKDTTTPTSETISETKTEPTPTTTNNKAINEPKSNKDKIIPTIPVEPKTIEQQTNKTINTDVEAKPGSDTIKVGNAGINPGKEDITKIITDASKAVGIDPNMMLTIAQVESRLNPNASNNTTSAKGLYQFINSTWTETVGKYGKKHNVTSESSPLDARANALMAAEYIKNNLNSLKGLSGDVGALEAYLTHFLGINGAKTFLKAPKDSIASTVVPKAAKSNYNIFYANGRPRTTEEVKEVISTKLNTAANKVGATIVMNTDSKPVETVKPTSIGSETIASENKVKETITDKSTLPVSTSSEVIGPQPKVTDPNLRKASLTNEVVTPVQLPKPIETIKEPKPTLTSTAPAAPNFNTKPVDTIKNSNAELLKVATETNTVLSESLTVQKGMLAELIKIAGGISQTKVPATKDEVKPKPEQRISEDRGLTRAQSKPRTNVQVDLSRPII